MRFVDGGKEQFLPAYSYLANAAEEENYSEFTESIVFCLEHYEQYNLVTKIAIADLVRHYGDRMTDLNTDRMINAIDMSSHVSYCREQLIQTLWVRMSTFFLFSLLL